MSFDALFNEFKLSRVGIIINTTFDII